MKTPTILTITLLPWALIGLCSATFSASVAAEESLPQLDNSSVLPTEPAPGPATAYYRWIDGEGHIQYTDFEPVGVPSELVPLTPADDETDAPMLVSAGEDRQPDPFHDQDEQILPIEHIGPCADARRQLAVLHASLPVYRDSSGLYRNAWRGDGYQGQRQYLDADNRTKAIGDARNAVLKHCSDPAAFAREADAFRDEIGTN